MKPDYLLAFDLETTGLDPHAPNAYVLEVGAVLVKPQPPFDVIAEASLVLHPPTDPVKLWASMDPVVRQMHAESGLWEATQQSDAWDGLQADRAIHDWLAGHAEGVVALAGSGVAAFDLQWARRHLPLTASRLAYFSFDVSPIRRLLELVDRMDLVDKVTDVDSKPHRGLADARLHLAELRRYAHLLQSIPRSGRG